MVTITSAGSCGCPMTVLLIKIASAAARPFVSPRSEPVHHGAPLRRLELDKVGS